MTKVYHGIIVDDDNRYSLVEICESCGVSAEIVIEMVDYGIFEPHGQQPQQWQFNSTDLIAIKKALRLQRDLELNLASLGVVMDLLEQVDLLRNKLQHYEEID